MNQDNGLFKSQYILKSLTSIDPGFIFNLAHNNDNNVTGIIWMTFYMRDNFVRFGNYLSIDVMHLSICNAKEYCCIVPVVNNEIEKINIVWEGFFITEKYNAYTFILELLFKVCPLRGKNHVCVIFLDEFMTKFILNSMGVYETFIFFDKFFHFKMNLKRSLLLK